MNIREYYDNDEWYGPHDEEETEMDPETVSWREMEKERQTSYSQLRNYLEDALDGMGFDDYELFGAGGNGEELSPLEYKGALRVVGPSSRKLHQKFIDTVYRIASANGFKIIDDRPPAVTHLFGDTIRSRGGEAAEISSRPVMYIYRSYHHVWPTGADIEQARRAGVEFPRTGYNVYENRVSEIAAEITDDPTIYSDSIAIDVASQISNTPEFKLMREEIKLDDIQRAISVPVSIGDSKVIATFMAESKNGSVYIDFRSPIAVQGIMETLAAIMSR